MVNLKKMNLSSFQSLGFNKKSSAISFIKNTLQINTKSFKTEQEFNKYLKPKISKLTSLGIDINDKKIVILIKHLNILKI